jgi:hypothetical protein
MFYNVRPFLENNWPLQEIWDFRDVWGRILLGHMNGETWHFRESWPLPKITTSLENNQTYSANIWAYKTCVLSGPVLASRDHQWSHYRHLFSWLKLLFTLSASSVASFITTKALSDSVNSTAALIIDFPSVAGFLFPHSDGILDMSLYTSFPKSRRSGVWLISCDTWSGILTCHGSDLRWMRNPETSCAFSGDIMMTRPTYTLSFRDGTARSPTPIAKYCSMEGGTTLLWRSNWDLWLSIWHIAIKFEGGACHITSQWWIEMHRLSDSSKVCALIYM